MSGLGGAPGLRGGRDGVLLLPGGAGSGVCSAATARCPANPAAPTHPLPPAAPPCAPFFFTAPRSSLFSYEDVLSAYRKKSQGRK